MEPTIFNLGIVIIGGLTTILTAFIGLKWVKYRALDSSYVSQKVKHYTDLSAEYKEEAKHWRGRFNQSKQEIQVDGFDDVTSENDVASVAKLVLPEILGMLPANVQKHAKGFLNNPDMINMAVKLYEKHPEECQRLMAGFLKKTGIKKGSDSPGSSTEEEISQWA